jgi:hypothetical protein
MILAMEALETSFSKIIQISSSLPSSLDVPSDPLGRPSRRPLARAAASPSLGSARRSGPLTWGLRAYFYSKLSGTLVWYS